MSLLVLFNWLDNFKTLYFMRLTAILALAYFILLSCKKEKETINYDIEGTVLDINDNSPINDATVLVSKREVSSGTFNSSYSTITSEVTTADGKYSFTTPYGTVESFKFQISRDNYYGKEVLINPDDLATNSINTLDFSLQSKGYINIRVLNATPWDQLDKISVNSINPSCANCVKFTSIQMVGSDIDTNLVGSVEANKYFKYQYAVTKNGSVNNYVDSVFCIIGDTTFKTLSF